MQTIYKYSLLSPRTTLQLPRTAQPLCVQMCEEKPMLWVLLDTDATTITRRFVALTTGEEIAGAIGRYIGTWQAHGLAYHLFEERV